MNFATITYAALIADLAMRARGWRNMEAEARSQGDEVKADQHKARAETLEWLIRDLQDQPVTAVSR